MQGTITALFENNKYNFVYIYMMQVIYFALFNRSQACRVKYLITCSQM